jgi:hypothetical protein
VPKWVIGPCQTGRMGDQQVDEHADVPDWVRKLGITDRLTGLERAAGSWDLLIMAGRKVLGTGMAYQVEHTVLSGFLARAQGLHEGAVAAIRADNPYAAFTLLRAYAENAAGVLYLKDHPDQLAKFWKLDSHGVKIATMTNYARERFGGFKGIYDQLSKYAHPAALSVLASSKVVGGEALSWQSAPAFKSEADAVVACAWVVELAHASSHLLVECAGALGLLPGVAGAPDADLS